MSLVVSLSRPFRLGLPVYQVSCICRAYHVYMSTCTHIPEFKLSQLSYLGSSVGRAPACVIGFKYHPLFPVTALGACLIAFNMYIYVHHTVNWKSRMSTPEEWSVKK